MSTANQVTREEASRSAKKSKKKKTNYLLEAITGLILNDKKGKVLDLGCGYGDYAYRLQQAGYEVVAADMDVERFNYVDTIEFKKADVTKPLPFEDNTFDYLILAEVIEHVRNPYDVVTELNRVLKVGGKIILSTPNVLSLKSRFRYLFEGCWDFFRETPLEHCTNPKEVIWNLHVIPWRYHELEYMLYSCNFKVEGNYTSLYEGYGYSIFLPMIKYQLASKASRSKRRGGMDQTRINKILTSKEILFGRHLIVKAVKQ